MWVQLQRHLSEAASRPAPPESSSAAAAEPTEVPGSSASATAYSDDEEADMEDLLGGAGAPGGVFNLGALNLEDLLAGLAAPAEGAAAAPGGDNNVSDMLAQLMGAYNEPDE